MNKPSMTARLTHLRQLLRTATDFRDPWDYFHDELVMDPTFLHLGRPEASRRLESVLGAVGSRLLGQEVRPRDLMLFHLKDQSLWHGTCGLGDCVTVCFHFEDVDQGLAGLMRDLTGVEILLARLSLVEMPPGVTSVARGGSA